VVAAGLMNSTSFFENEPSSTCCVRCRRTSHWTKCLLTRESRGKKRRSWKVPAILYKASTSSFNRLPFNASFHLI